MRTSITLSDEQQLFVKEALEGHNILVNACIGSGKTTAIQMLCDRLPANKKILYLTYNKLLKIDARSKIKSKNVTVTNYHGFAYMCLKKINISASVNDMISNFNNKKPPIDRYDVLIIDEYQDIETEFTYMLDRIKEANPNIQIIAVGDMDQKIYDKTTLNVPQYISSFLGSYIELEFTLCFRLSADLASLLGRIWHKTIVGVNQNCKVETMSVDEVTAFLATKDASDILCLGARTGDLSKTLNKLESEYPEKFNKKNVYASISDRDGTGSTQPNYSSAIFTTFDSSKGLERSVCVVFDFTESYWNVRVRKPQQSYTILRNIFCVAASRGKERIIFVKQDEALLSEKTISTDVKCNDILQNVGIKEMFDFKYKEDIDACFNLLKYEKLQSLDYSPIEAKNKDYLIDLSPCIGIYQEAMYFDDYNIDNDIDLHMKLNKDQIFLLNNKVKRSDLETKILFLTSLETRQARYTNQVELPFVSESAKEQISERIGTKLKHNEKVQVYCDIDFAINQNCTQLFSAIGYADAIKDNVVYELKFVSELSHEHFLQCACYIVALGLSKGILWNIRDNTAYEITIPDKTAFLDAVVKAVTKGKITKCYTTQNKTADIKDSHTKHPTSKTTSTERNSISKYTIGTRIIHKMYGKGTIIEFSENNIFHVIKVLFENGNTQSFSLEILLKAGLITAG